MEPSASFFLWNDTRPCRILQKLIGTVTVIGRNRNPNARANDDIYDRRARMAGSGFDDAGSQGCRGLHRQLRAGLHNRKLVATGSGDQILSRTRSRSRLEAAHSNASPTEWPSVSVDDLEVVEVQTEDGRRSAMPDISSVFPMCSRN